MVRGSNGGVCTHIPTRTPILDTSFKPKSTLFPSSSKGPFIETYYHAVYKDLLALCDTPKNPKQNNLTKEENQALNDLKTNANITIKQADKGGSIVIQNKVDYIKEASRLLTDTDTYLKLPSDPLPGYQLTLKTLIYTAWEKGVLTKKERQFFLPSECNTPHFYHLPKIHKSLTDPPG